MFLEFVDVMFIKVEVEQSLPSSSLEEHESVREATLAAVCPLSFSNLPSLISCLSILGRIDQSEL